MKALTLLAVVLTFGLATISINDAEAARLGGGKSSGMQRSAPPAATPRAPSAAPAAPAAPAPAAQPGRSWMGPLAGLAAGIGLAALASHFGFGGALANVMTMVLIGVAVLFLVGFLMRRFGKSRPQQGLQGMQFSGAGAPFPGQQPLNAAPQASGSPEIPVQAAAVAAPVANDGFDVAGFEQIAKRVFLRLQQANDAADQNDLRRFTTPEMFSSIQAELLERKGFQHTEVLQLDSKVIERVEENGLQIVSVRFSGMLREQAEAERFDEVWHLVRPLDGSRDWAIAGIQQSS